MAIGMSLITAGITQIQNNYQVGIALVITGAVVSVVHEVIGEAHHLHK